MTTQIDKAYRFDIDGLRALAVIAVIVFHANHEWLYGGFIGVDIFFVISGFLITGVIVKAIDNNNFSFGHFYTRRIRRIFPAYIVVSLATLACASWLLIPNDYIYYTTSSAASWVFVSNVFFSMLSSGYFGQRTEEFPLLHTWSLSVEEQFYFIFPILLLIGCRYFRKQMIPVLLVLCAVFVAVSQYGTGNIKSYFFLTSRAHELLVGALTYFLLQRSAALSRPTANIIAFSGLALVLGSLILIHPEMPFPGIYSLYPVIGTGLLIYAGKGEHDLKFFLQNRITVFIGKISYSLYLWHWPIFALLRYRGISMTTSIATAAIALSFLFSWLTWKFVENPVRKNTNGGFRAAVLNIYLAPALLCLAVGLYSYKTNGIPNRFSPDVRALISSYSFERDLSRSCAITQDDYQKIDSNYLLQHCTFGAPGKKTADILLMGDSHANHFKPFVDELAKGAGLKAVFHVQGSCLPVDLGSDGAAANACEKRNTDLLQLAGNYKYVFIAGLWSHETDTENLEKSFDNTVSRIVKAGATPVIFKDTPYFDEDLSQCVLWKKRGWISQQNNCNIPMSFVEKNNGPADRIIDRVKSSYPQTVVIDPKILVCNSKECTTSIGDMALYKDNNHINSKAAVLLGDRYISSQSNFLITPQK